MSRPRCPGQDKRNWTPDDISYVACPHCGAEIEFWKDESTRVCRDCGVEVGNPNLGLTCAQWCEMAKVCLGSEPNALAPVDSAPPAAPAGRAEPLCNCILTELKEVFGEEQGPMDRAARVLGYANEILNTERGDPLVVKAAAIFHGAGIQAMKPLTGARGERDPEKEDWSIASGILQKLGVEAQAIDRISRIIESLHSAGDLDTSEFRIVSDAAWLVNLPEEYPNLDKATAGSLLERIFRTGKGHQLARREFLD